MIAKKPKVAYFCMEFGLHEDLKIYSGGLGILAGDILKAAKDANDPMVGVGILWRQGYTSQHIDENGKVFDSYHEYSYDFLEDTGVTVTIPIKKDKVKAKVWKCTEYGNVPLYLLDTNLPDNPEWYITGQLYGWFDEERIAQEMILSIGGVKALKKLGIVPDVYHFNDSHPVFAGVELIHEAMKKENKSFEDALAEVKSKIVFTTHTPVVAGNEVHSHRLLKYMGAYDGLTYSQMKEIGGDPFSMTAAGLRLSRKANAVAVLHGKTAREMWKDIPGGKDIIAITNGVHNKTWQDSSIIKAKDGGGLYEAHLNLKRAMINEICRRNKVKLDENVLTIGFARRAAPYKRSDLLFKNSELISKLISERKLQIVFAGKAHPNDMTGKKIITNLFAISKKFPESVVFIEDYDMKVGKMLTRGCDVWLNNPIRPMEASGTSGMKAAMNGVLNFSVLDGWWPEGCVHGVNGWSIGGGYQGEDADKIDSESLYKVLQEEVIPTFYDNKNKWVKMMKASIEMSSYRFSAERMVKEYYEKMYSI